MRIKSYEEMNLQELDVMKEISSIGTSHAATSLSKLLQKEIRISIPEVSVLGYEEAVEKIGEIEELVAATLVQMSNDVNGLILFIFKMDMANAVLEKLIGKMRQMGGKCDASPAQVATAWAIAKGTLPIIGVTKAAQVEAAAKAVEIVLTAEEVSELETLGDAANINTLREWEKEM